MERRVFLAAAATAGAPLLAGCGGGGDGEPSMEATVRIESPGNQPREVRLAVGGTVTWVNADSAIVNDHTVTAAKFHEEATEWEFDEELTEEGQETSYTFEEAGIYEYYDRNEGEQCRCGVILVGDVDTPGVLPCVGTSPAGC